MFTEIVQALFNYVNLVLLRFTMAQNKATDSLRQQRLLLQMEYYAEKEAFRKQTETQGLMRKVKRGDAWFPIRIGKSYYNSLNQLSLEVFRTQDQDIEHNFEFGRPVVFFSLTRHSPLSPLTPHFSYYNFTANVSYVDGDRMVVTVMTRTRFLSTHLLLFE